MMNIENTLVALMFCLLSLPLVASTRNMPDESPDFSYSVQTHPKLDQEIESALSHFDNLLNAQELEQIFVADSIAESKASLQTVNRIYSAGLGDTVVFIKAGVTPNLPLLMDKTVRIEGGYLSHIKNPNGLVMAIYIKTDSWESASQLYSTIKEKSVSLYKPVGPVFEFLSSAHAQNNDCVNCAEKIPKPKNNLEEINKAVEEKSSPIQHISGCALSAMKGYWNGSAGMVYGGGKEIGKLIISPIETGKKYWESVSKLWDVTTHFFADFENEARKLYASFDTLDPLMKTKLACEIIGTIGGGVLLTYATAGVMGSSVTANLSLQIKKALESVLKLSKYSKTRKELAAKALTIVKADAELNKNFLNIQRGTPRFAKVKNETVMAELNAHPVNAGASSRKAAFTDDEIQKLYRQVSDHPVASLSLVDKYSKTAPGMGFCFGRATTAHVKALTNGLDKTAVKKVWALGTLKTGSTNWRYHVTTIVRDSKGKWQAIDPIMGGPVSVEQWYSRMKSFDSSNDMRIFVSEPNRFSPSGGKYKREVFTDKRYDGYFEDLMSSFRKESKEVMTNR